eukprot:4157333-Pyramimonas_sp.AAC.1
MSHHLPVLIQILSPLLRDTIPGRHPRATLGEQLVKHEPTNLLRQHAEHGVPPARRSAGWAGTRAAGQRWAE